MAERFTDLARVLSSLETETPSERVKEVQRDQPWSSIVAIGGFPVVHYEGEGLTWCGSRVDTGRVSQEVLHGLGLSGMLTYMNKGRHTYGALGFVCLNKGHDWAYRWMTFSLVFVGFGLQAELAFTRDTRFQMSWPVNDSTGGIFVANASLKEWRRFLAHVNDPDWDEASRNAMKSAYFTLDFLLTEVFQNR